MTPRDRTRRGKRNRVPARILVLIMAVLLAVASSGCVGSSATQIPPPAAPTTTTQPPQTAVSAAPPAETPTGDAAATPTAAIAAVVASRTPKPTRAPGPLEEAVSAATDAVGVADTTILGLTTDDWINMWISVLMVLLAAAFAAPVLKRVLRRAVRTTSTDLDDRLVTAVFPQLWHFVSLVVIDLAIMRLDFLSDRLRILLSDLFFLLYTAIVGVALWKLLGVATDWYAEQLTPEQKDDEAKIETALTLVRRVGKIAIIVLCVSVALEHFGIKITAVAASFGLIALAFSLAAQDTLADAIAGFIIRVDRPFRVGDRIEIEELGKWGDVVEIGARTTRIRTLDNRMVIVPNSVIGKNQVINYTYPDPRYRVQIEVGIGYDSDIDAARHIIMEAVKKVDGVEQDKPVDALFLEFGDSAIIMRVRWWIDSYVDTRRMFDKVNEAMYKALDAAGVDMPNTTYDVNVRHVIRDVERLPAAPQGRSGADSDAGG